MGTKTTDYLAINQQTTYYLTINQLVDKSWISFPILLTNRPPAIMAVMATAALTAANPRASAIAWKPTWKIAAWWQGKKPLQLKEIMTIS